MVDQVGYRGTAEATDNGSDFNANTYLVWSILARVRTMQVCEVMSVTNSGGISPVGFVTLKPMVNQIDGYDNAMPHGEIFNVPYFRLQGGANAIILDPQIGDIGWAGFADRDISSVKATKAQANPGSKRMFSMADAVYFGGILNGTPNQYIAFSASGIAVSSPSEISINAGGNVSVTATGNATINAASVVIKATSITLQNAGTALKALLNSAFATWAENHVHSNGNGGANTGTPTTTPPTSSQTSIVTAE